jgi:hypothetical protein
LSTTTRFIQDLDNSSELLSHLILFQSNIVGEGDDVSLSFKSKETIDHLLSQNSASAQWQTSNMLDSSTHCNMGIATRFAYMEQTTTVVRTTTTTVHEVNRADELDKYDTVVTSIKKLFLGALQTEGKNDDLLAVPLMILQSPLMYQVPEERSGGDNVCFLCGRSLNEHSLNAQRLTQICYVCEGEAYILFSNGLALSSPSRRTSGNMPLHHVLIRQNQKCLAPEWSMRMTSSRSHQSGWEENPLQCKCDFCAMLVVGNGVVSRKVWQMCMYGMQNTDAWKLVDNDPHVLCMFRHKRSGTYHLEWNENVKYNTDEDHFAVMCEIVRHYVPSLAKVSSSLGTDIIVTNGH